MDKVGLEVASRMVRNAMAIAGLEVMWDWRGVLEH